MKKIALLLIFILTFSAFGNAMVSQPIANGRLATFSYSGEETLTVDVAQAKAEVQEVGREEFFDKVFGYALYKQSLRMAKSDTDSQIASGNMTFVAKDTDESYAYVYAYGYLKNKFETAANQENLRFQEAMALTVAMSAISRGKAKEAVEAEVAGGAKGAVAKVKGFFPKNPADFKPEGLVKSEYNGGRIIKWKDPKTGKAIYEYNADDTYGNHYHYTPDGKNREFHPETGDTHIKPGDSVPGGGSYGD